MLAEESRGPPASDLAAVPVLCSFAPRRSIAHARNRVSFAFLFVFKTSMMFTVRRAKRKIIGTEKTKSTMAKEHNGPLLQFGCLSNKVNDWRESNKNNFLTRFFLSAQTSHVDVISIDIFFHQFEIASFYRKYMLR